MTIKKKDKKYIIHKVKNNFIFLFISKKIPEPINNAMDVCLKYAEKITVNKLIR
ncbi:hypothetical protein OAI81_00865 [Candidatus Pelagibacter sp.]|nr:hypothetical protein [Candidatus Pelagibacter sp.]